MPIKSYLAYPQTGQKKALLNALSNFPECESVPAENQDVVVIVSETNTQLQEKRVEQALNQLPTLAHLSLVAVYE